jgi:hypothetical protein
MEPHRLVCWECLDVADERARGWRAYRADDGCEDAAPLLLFSCPDCAEREPGGPSVAQIEVPQFVRMLRTAAEAAPPPGPASAEEHTARSRARAFGRYLLERIARPRPTGWV